MLLQIQALQRHIPGGNGMPAFAILNGVDLSLAQGESVALVGRSGAGKTTLLHLIAGLDRPDAGSLHFMQLDLATLSPAQLAHLRRDQMGLVFQNNLSLPALPVWENAALPLLLRGAPRAEARRAALVLLERVGLAPYARAATTALSGGQRRRLGLARALITRPRLLLADEPTSDLDDTTAAEIESLMFDLLGETHGAALIVTHSDSIERRAHRVVRLDQGRLAAA